MSIGKISTCLWFENQAKEAASYYVSIFAPDSKITTIQRYSEANKEQHGREPGSVMVVEFDLLGHHFVALNGGPAPWTVSEAMSRDKPKSPNWRGGAIGLNMRNGAGAPTLRHRYIGRAPHRSSRAPASKRTDVGPGRYSGGLQLARPQPRPETQKVVSRREDGRKRYPARI